MPRSGASAPSPASCTYTTAWCSACWLRPDCPGSAAAAALADRCLPAVHPRDAGEVPIADGQPPVCDGARARLPRQPRSLPPPVARIVRVPGGGVPAAAQLARGAGSSGLGALRPSADRPCAPPLMAFVMVLWHSRQIFLHFFLDARMENFLRGHVAALTAWGGVPRVLLYDNLKSAVLERQGDAIRFNPTLLGFAAHHRSNPVRSPWPRQRERPRRAGHRLVRALLCRAQIHRSRRPQCPGRGLVPRPSRRPALPGRPARTVREVFTDEAPRLLPLPGNPRRCRTRRGQSRQNPLRPLRPERLFRAAYPCAADIDRARRHRTRSASSMARRCSPAIPAATTRAHRSRIPPTSRRLVAHKRAARQHRAPTALPSRPASPDLLVRAAERGPIWRHHPGLTASSLATAPTNSTPPSSKC